MIIGIPKEIMAEGKVTLKPIADLFGLEHCPIESVISG